MPDDDYPPEAIGVLAGMEPPARDPDDPRVRWCRAFLEDPSEPLLPVTSPRVQAALEQIMRDSGFTEAMIRTRFPEPPEDATNDVVVTVRLRADGGLVVSSPRTPPHRIVATRKKRAGAVGQRVAELVEEALRERERRGS